MSLTRKMLKAMGIEDEKIDQIIEAHTEVTDQIRAERDSYKDKASSADKLQETVDQLRQQLKEAHDNDKSAQLQEQLDKAMKDLADAKEEATTARGEFDAYKTDVEAREMGRAKRKAYRGAIEKAGIAQKYVDAILRVAKVDEIKLAEDGTIEDAETLVNAIKGEFPEFVAKSTTSGANTETPPDNGGGGKVVEGANPLAVQIARDRHERLYGAKSD